MDLLALDGDRKRERYFVVPGITQTSRNFFKLLYSDSPGSDFDNDGLSNSDEVKIHGLDPFNSDFDGDGMPDGWEIMHGLIPKAPETPKATSTSAVYQIWRNFKTAPIQQYPTPTVIQ